MHVEKVIDHIVSWLKDYAEKSATNGFVVGVSGGIDSAVTSSLCAKTGLPLHCLEMPIHQGVQQVNRAKEHIAQLCNRYNNVQSVEIDLTSTFECFKTSLPDTAQDERWALSLANTRARLRMTTLYYFAGLHQYLVAGTGNKVEDFGVGFFTKYGDGGVDLSPIADLLKSEVYTLASGLQVPDSILQAAPTDGLFGDSRTDEDQMGASYEELEWAMEQDAQGRSLLDFEGRKKEVFGIYKQRNTANRHKIAAIPVCKIPRELL